MPLLRDIQELVTQLLEWNLAADGPGLDALNPARLIQPEIGDPLRLDQEGLHRIGDSLQLQRRDLGEVEPPADDAIGVTRDLNPARRRGGLDAGRSGSRSRPPL